MYALARIMKYAAIALGTTYTQKVFNKPKLLKSIKNGTKPAPMYIVIIKNL